MLNESRFGLHNSNNLFGTVLRYILSFLIEIGEIIEPSSLVMSYIEFHSTSLVKLQTFNY